VNVILRKMSFSMSAALLAVTAICQAPRNSAPPRIRNYSGAMEQQAKQRGRTVLEGDIVIDKPAANSGAQRPRPDSLTVAMSSSLWPQVAGVATVYYVNANAGAMDSVDEAANANIQTAVNTFNADFSGLIQWVQTTPTSGVNYVLIDLNAGDYSGECEAAEGYEAEKAQPMDGSAQCTVGTILHEMGHIIGLWHEQSRPDASNYITMNYNNAIKGSWGNFETITQNAQTLGLYDYASVMQYPPFSFSRNGGPVIETIPAGMPLANVEGVPVPASVDYSAGDKEAIERLYGTAPTQVTITSNPQGLQVVVDGSNITTPQTFAWALNSKHTLDVASGLQTLSGDIEASTTPATFYYTYGRWNDNGGQSHTITVLPGDGGVGFPSSSPQVATYSANFIQLVPYTTTIYPSGEGSAGITPTPQSYPNSSNVFLVARQQATLTASAVPGWNFYEFNNGPFWLTGGLGANPKTFYVPDTGNPIDTTVEFSNTPVYTVDVTPETFSSNLSVYVDGDFWYTPVNFSHYYDYPDQPTPDWTTGSTHTLNFVSPELPYSVNSRYGFSKWSDGLAESHSIASLPAAGTSYIATVTPQFAPATNFSYPPCGGTGDLTPPSPTNDGFYPTGTQLTYTATPGTDWTFGGWTFDLTGTTNPGKLIASDETLVFANFNLTNVPLTLTGLSPSAANSGGAAFTMTLYGTGFSTDSVVGITSASGTSYPTVTYVNSGEMTIPIAAAQISAPGNLQIYVENFPPGSNGCAVFGYQTFLIHAKTLATSTVVTSSANPANYGNSVTLTATVTSSESNATGTVSFKSGNTIIGTSALSGVGVATFTTSSLAPGSDSITVVYSGDSNNSSSGSSALIQTVNATAATMTSPVQGSTLTGPVGTFTWTNVPSATGYELWLGSTGPGSYNVHYSGESTATSLSTGSLPVNGETVYATLYTYFGSAKLTTNYTYTASTMAAITSPTPETQLAGPSITFNWSTSVGATGYAFWLGSTGPASHDIRYTGESTATSMSIATMPTNGETIYATLYTYYGSVREEADYTYTATALAALTSPTSGTTLTSTNITFNWTSSSGATGYALWLGSTGQASHDIRYSDESTATSLSLTDLPANGKTIYATLYTYYGSLRFVNYYTFTAVTPAALTSPTPGTALTGPVVTFNWTSLPGATGYALWLGSTGVGSYNIRYDSQSTATSLSLTNLPTNGETIYARLITYFGSTQAPVDTTYTAASQATMSSPASGSMLPGASVNFQWTAPTDATAYQIAIGTTGVGSSNLDSSGTITTNSFAANNLPTAGGTVYVRLSAELQGVWVDTDYTYTAE